MEVRGYVLCVSNRKIRHSSYGRLDRASDMSVDHLLAGGYLYVMKMPDILGAFQVNLGPAWRTGLCILIQAKAVAECARSVAIIRKTPAIFKPA